MYLFFPVVLYLVYSQMGCTRSSDLLVISRLCLLASRGICGLFKPCPHITLSRITVCQPSLYSSFASVHTFVCIQPVDQSQQSANQQPANHHVLRSQVLHADAAFPFKLCCCFFIPTVHCIHLCSSFFWFILVLLSDAPHTINSMSIFSPLHVCTTSCL